MTDSCPDYHAPDRRLRRGGVPVDVAALAEISPEQVIRDNSVSALRPYFEQLLFGDFGPLRNPKAAEQTFTVVSHMQALAQYLAIVQEVVSLAAKDKDATITKLRQENAALRSQQSHIKQQLKAVAPLLRELPTCGICGKMFVRNSFLQSHLATKHHVQGVREQHTPPRPRAESTVASIHPRFAQPIVHHVTSAPPSDGSPFNLAAIPSGVPLPRSVDDIATYVDDETGAVTAMYSVPVCSHSASSPHYSHNREPAHQHTRGGLVNPVMDKNVHAHMLNPSELVVRNMQAPQPGDIHIHLPQQMLAPGASPSHARTADQSVSALDDSMYEVPQLQFLDTNEYMPYQPSYQREAPRVLAPAQPAYEIPSVPPAAPSSGPEEDPYMEMGSREPKEGPSQDDSRFESPSDGLDALQSLPEPEIAASVHAAPKDISNADTTLLDRRPALPSEEDGPSASTSPAAVYNPDGYSVLSDHPSLRARFVHSKEDVERETQNVLKQLEAETPSDVHGVSPDSAAKRQSDRSFNEYSNNINYKPNADKRRDQYNELSDQ